MAVKHIAYFTDADAALDEARHLCLELGVDHCIVHGYEKRKRHMYNVVRRDKLLSNKRLVAELSLPKW